MSRTNNINLHTQDYAQQVLIEKQKLTNGLKSANNLQQILDLIGETALKSYQLPISSQQISGIVRSATQAEVDAGTATNIYVSPLTLKNTVTKPEATETVKGIARFQTVSDGNNVNETRAIINPKILHTVLDTRKATETKAGTITTSTQQQAEAGVDNQSQMTPLRVKQAIAKFTPKVEFATSQETVQGYTRLATKAQVQQGTLNVGYAVQPKQFVESRATTSTVGTVKLATNDQAIAGTATDVVITPQNLKAMVTSTATSTKSGFVKLTNDVNNTDTGTALSPLAKVVPQTRTINGKQLANNISITSDDVNCYNKQESDARYFGQGIPQGQIISFAGQNAPSGYLLCHGQTLNRNQYQQLFNAIGYTYGGSGDQFRIPDLRGEFIRGFDSGRGADRNRTFGSWQKGTAAVGNGADYQRDQAHGMALAPNLSGEGRWEWERPRERCRYGIYHCRNHPARWIGPENVQGNMSRYQAIETFGGDAVTIDNYRGVQHQWGNGNTGQGSPVMGQNDRIGQDHVMFATRPRNVAMHYIIKV